MANAHQTFLIQVDGPDEEGITTHVLGTLARAGASIQDVEQIVIRNHISLNIVAQIPDGRDLLKELLLVGYERGLNIEFEPVDATPTRKPTGTIVTVLGQTLEAAELAAVTGVVTTTGGNVDRRHGRCDSAKGSAAAGVASHGARCGSHAGAERDDRRAS